MKQSNLKYSCLIAVLYFGMNMNAQVTSDSAKVQKIDEVVMIGYGSRKKVDNTTSISSISAEEVTKTKVLNASQAIQGKAAGVQVTASDAPGSTPTVMIRGLGTVLGGRTPLYVVDGMFTDNINNINSNDILTYDILKDAAALAIYGNRAANGVIIITTKSGRGKLSVSYDGLVGFRTPLKTIKMANASEFVNYNNAGSKSDFISPDQPYNTDWFKEITRTGIYNQHNLSISGSSEAAKYFLSLGNYDEQSILNGTNYNRTTIRTNNEFRITKGIRLAQTLSATFTNDTPKSFGAFTNAYKQASVVPVYYPNGKYGQPIINKATGELGYEGGRFNNVANPVMQMAYDNQRGKNFLLQGGLKLDIDIVKDLKFTSQFSGEYGHYKYYNFVNSRALWLDSDPMRTEAQYSSTSPKTRLTNKSQNYYNWLINNYLTYTKKVGNHDIELVAGTEASVKSGLESTIINRKNVPVSPDYWNLSGVDYYGDLFSEGDTKAIESIQGNRNTTISYFGRFQYKFMNRYLLSGTIRRDGSSQFAAGQRWGTFPSFGAGWIISQENFMQDGFFDMLKLRGGWGKIGNQTVPLNYLPLSLGSSYNYGYGSASVSNGVTVNKGYDPDLGWEVTEESSLGLDFGILNNRLTGTFDVYNRKTKNLILGVVPYMSTGISELNYSHMGSVVNKGFEVSLNWADKVGEDFSYSIGGNYSYNKNTLASMDTSKPVSQIVGGNLGNGIDTKLFNASAVGYALGSFYLFEADGYNEKGELKFKDINGDGVIDAKDKRFFGSYIPKSTLGVNVSMSYKNWDFALNGYGSFGFKVYNGKKAQRNGGENVEASVANNFWTPNNTNAANPVNPANIPVASTFYLEDGDFFRINNISVGYTFKNVTDYMKSIKLYVSAINPFVFQKYSGYSSELSGYNPTDTTTEGDPYKRAGIELDAYPTLRSFVFGVNLNF
ncbi:SusC/RagA family TonB-linked outer membrane protein [Chryseobacterium pennipullorum]|uniref:SusC/RagA family TonB-linked outer membrane protein n=1 Tax=Chryseobacterium pennipullorum TaxID=2258963 RepID=A0A3D9BA68_9FLAO|nr:SusC/RagA family TonB-linked outer membrane protein [Chryseobacterium pennipullorum]REC50339.1 SusC/RagA family TonB-linked outer membrane protein [Chryseobacterium pennipullorum]